MVGMYSKTETKRQTNEADRRPTCREEENNGKPIDKSPTSSN